MIGIDLTKYVTRYQGVSYLANSKGFIAWRRGTGDNVELLHIKTHEKGRGYGRALVYQMLDSLRDDPPYATIFGFTRSSNEESQQFYGALGFNLQVVEGLYQEGTAVLFHQNYEQLCLLKDVYERENRLHR